MSFKKQLNNALNKKSQPKPLLTVELEVISKHPNLQGFVGKRTMQMHGNLEDVLFTVSELIEGYDAIYRAQYGVCVPFAATDHVWARIYDSNGKLLEKHDLLDEDDDW